MTTSNGSVQLTPGQRCLLELTQNKLLYTIQCYVNLRKLEPSKSIDEELHRLEEKIRRISAKQKRFTLEIISGNSNNTIPKETFFQALGLVTKEEFARLNSKSNERRRRTTANPRFSHEAIQAKRALEPLQKRLDSRNSRAEKRDNASSNARKPQRIQQSNSRSSDTNNKSNSNQNPRNCTSRNNGGTNSASGRNSSAKKGSSSRNNANNQQARRTRDIDTSDISDLVPFLNLIVAKLHDQEAQINTKRSQVQSQLESNEKLARDNEVLMKMGLDLKIAIDAVELVALDQSF